MQAAVVSVVFACVIDSSDPDKGAQDGKIAGKLFDVVDCDAVSRSSVYCKGS